MCDINMLFRLGVPVEGWCEVVLRGENGGSDTASSKHVEMEGEI